jgi:hypothetical protein
MSFLLICELFGRDYDCNGRDDISMSTSDFPDHHMATNVVKKRIVTRLGTADYTGPVNASGQPQGLGSFTVVADGAYKGWTYEGHFFNGKCEGLGKETANDGRIWQGEFKENKLNGFVKVVSLQCDLSYSFQFTNAKGNVHEGLFKDGKSHGLGTVGLKLFSRLDDGSTHGPMVPELLENLKTANNMTSTCGPTKVSFIFL